VISNKIKLLVIGIALIGAASVSYACDGAKKEAKNTSATNASADGGSCASKSATKTASGDACATKGAKMAGADGCCAKGAKGTMASADGDHCAANSKSAMALAYGKNTVTSAGACPTKNDANYSFYVAGAECKGTGTEVAQAVKSVKGVASVTVDYDKHMVYVCADGKTASKQAIEKSLKTAGYEKVKFVNDSKDNCPKSPGKVEA